VGHTGLARLCLVHWCYRARRSPTSTGGGGCHYFTIGRDYTVSVREIEAEEKPKSYVSEHGRVLKTDIDRLSDNGYAMYCLTNSPEKFIRAKIAFYKNKVTLYKNALVRTKDRLEGWKEAYRTLNPPKLRATRIMWDVDEDPDVDYLPSEIDIPADMTDEDEISDYLSELTGVCHEGYILKEIG